MQGHSVNYNCNLAYLGLLEQLCEGHDRGIAAVLKHLAATKAAEQQQQPTQQA